MDRFVSGALAFAGAGRDNFSYSLEAQREAAHPWMYRLLAATLVLNLVDLVLTLSVVQSGLAIEANPLMAALLEHSPLSFASLKLLMVSGGVVTLWSLRRHHFAWLGTLVAFGAYALILLVHTQSVRLMASHAHMLLPLG